jgi:outer membrane receptor protein involved in Fe transport
MKLDANKLSNAVRLALAMGTVASAGAVGSAYAQNADNTDNKSQNLETIVVTGSNIRRVDIETANPVLTIDHAAIQQSGKLTLGDLVQSLPSIAGAALNPNVNNGGGDGSSRISLRGLGTNRSLLLINGHRVPAQLQDLNIIPASAVERIEVLSDGSSAVYGSDAVAGVVNIITRTNYQGAEFGADYGESDHDDGARKSYHAMFGQSTDKGSIILGLNYNKTESVLAANRAYSHDALYKYNTGYVLHGGSSRTPGGKITLPKSSPLAQALGCTNVTRANKNSGPTSDTPSDYRCYKPTDAFNYQAVGNYDQTPGERTGVFALGNYKLTDSVEAFMEVFHNKTVSRQQIAPVPFDAQTDGVVIPSNQYYNPFVGVTFGPGAQEVRTRLTSLGNRATDYSTTHDLATFGFKGSFGDTGWTWFADASYGKKSQTQQFVDYINYSSLAANFACTQASCNPINLFNLNQDPASIALLNSAKISPFIHNMYQMKSGEAGVSGSVFALPAGDVQLAVGASYRKEYVDDQVDPLILTKPDANFNFFCSGPGSICSSSTQGGFTVKEAYAELFVPLLKDLPFVHSLNLDIGDRYSKYSDFGSTSNWKVALEFKPIEDLLIRGTVSKVFRAPTVSDLYAGPSGDSPTALDPCTQPGAATNPACPGIVPPTGLSQTNGIVAGSQWAKANIGTTNVLTPENGKSYDYGFVYDPQWLPGLSVNADYYRIVLNNLIVSGAGTASTILTDCYNSNGASPLCSLIKRYTSGSSLNQIQNVFETPFNSGNLETKGADFGVAYRLPETPFGNFRVNLQTTYIQAYTITQDDGTKQQYAGHFDKTFGNFARWRGLGTLDWNWGAFNAQWQARYIGPITVGYANAGLGPSASADGAYTPDGASVYHYGAYVYHNVSFGYNIEPINTQVQVGVDNVANKQPPILYQQNVINANTDVNTYDTVGRFFWGKITVKF